MSFCISISIHAPVKGATYRLLYSGWRVLDFNPRSREGSDNTLMG